MGKILVLFAHPAMHKSRVNRMMAAAAHQVEGLTFHDLYETYPDFVIDTRREQELLASHDHVVLQHPLYWYSAPSIFKEWIDLVLEVGFAYGPGGDSLRGKTWMHALTAGGPEVAYQVGGLDQGSMRQFLAPFEQTAKLCGMRYLPPFIANDRFRLPSSRDIPLIADNYAKMLVALRDTREELA